MTTDEHTPPEERQHEDRALTESDRKALTRQAAIVFAIVATVVGLVLGYVEKRRCNPPRVWDGYQYRFNCYTDIHPLYGDRGKPFDEKEDYRPFSSHGIAYRDNHLEYPPLTGLFISTVNAPVKEGNVAGFLSANAFGLSAFALAGAAALGAIARRPRRLLLYAVAPAMLAYAFHNWDLIAVGFTAMAIWAFTREDDNVAASLAGLGAAAKIFPGLLLVPFMIARARDGRPWRPMLGWGLFWFAVPNAIVLAYAGADGWWFPYDFQSTRLPNFETHWYFLLHHGQRWWPGPFWFDGTFARSAQAMSLLIFAVSGGLLIWRELRRERFRPIVTSFGLVLLFLMTTKVYSPQFALWLLPFFVLVGVPWHAYLAFVIGDVLALTAVWTYFTAFADKTDAGWHFVFLEIAVWVRYVGLGYVLWWTRRGEELIGEESPDRIGPASPLWEAAPPEPRPIPAPQAPPSPHGGPGF